mmetsp:Transcript_27489/g.35704  ORF Transcript_27489/g.35704 Transcript_27489/m.35704 type:complete len:83 (+) Transcript_27489:40-288(+)
MEIQSNNGLTQHEMNAYKICKPKSCAHAACLKRFMYADDAKQKLYCEPLYLQWEECFNKIMKSSNDNETRKSGKMDFSNQQS